MNINKDMEEFKKTYDDAVENKLEQTLEERVRVEKRRSFYPRKITEVGGLSPKFVRSLQREIIRLKELDPSIVDAQILKALDFEIR